MQISSKAWHLKLVRYLEDDYKPKNLCQHFWTVVAVVLFMAITAPLKVVVWVGLFIAAKLPTFKRKPKGGENPPGLIRSYIKARKERYCPLIEVVEDKPHDP